MRLALAQINTIVGDLDGNRDLILARLEEAREPGADLVLFPELAVTGYPPEDLLLRPSFVRAAEQSLARDRARRRATSSRFVGSPHLDRDLYNACAVCADGEVKALYRKRFLPNYGVFDEHRYFAPGRDLFLLEHGDTLLGPTVCEDIWQPGPPATDLALAGAQLIVNISASPFHVGKEREREEMLQTRARDNVCYVAFVNAVGGAGRAHLRRALGRARRRGRGARARARVRGGAARRRHRAEEAVGRRLRDVRRRSLEREREAVADVPVVARRRRAAAADGSVGPRGRADARRPRADAARARARPARLRTKERVRRRRDRHVGRDRLGPDRGDRRRGARATSACTASRCRRGTRSEGTRSRRAAARRERSATALPRAPDRADRRGFRRGAAPSRSPAASRT